MTAHLVPLDEGPPISMDRPIVFIGRHADCDVRIDSKKISRRHCCLVQLFDKLMIRDLGSTNGIYRNGQKVDEAVLAKDDEVRIANVRYQVVVEVKAATTVPTAADESTNARPDQTSPAQDDG